MQTDELGRTYERLYGPFTHMGPGDKAIWTKYLLAGGAQFAPFTYDLRVGDGADLGPNPNQLQRSIAAALTRKRIDVLYYRDGNPIIVEVKQRAGLTAIGQLLGYQRLFMRDNPSSPMPILVLVTDVLQPDMVDTLIEYGIAYYEVGQI
jgi:hypothetical protein